MTKILVILFISLFFEAIGVVFLSRGLRQIPAIDTPSIPALALVVKEGATNKNILLGVFFEALFFAGLLTMMSRSDVTFVWPLTSLGFVFTTVAAKWWLHEEVSAARWLGVTLIMLGAGLITWTEHEKSPPPATSSTVEGTPAAR
jgi:drug/metabolite transporter (DMT)-like permease